MRESNGPNSPLNRVLAFSLGNCGYILQLRFQTLWLVALLHTESNTHGLSISSIGLALGIGQIVDSFIDPFIGAKVSGLGEKSRIRLLRAVSVLLPLSAALCFFTPFQSFELSFLYLATFVSLFRALYSLYQVPYLATIPEVSQSESDQVQFSKWIGTMTLVAVVISMASSGVLLEHFGKWGTIIGFCVLSAALLYTPTHYIKLNHPHEERKARNLKDYILVLKDSYFVKSIIGILAAGIVYTALAILTPFYVKDILEQSRSYVSLLFGTTFLITFITLPFLGKLTQKFTQEALMQFALSLYCVCMGLLSTIAYWNLQDLKLPLSIMVFGLIGIALALSLTLTQSLIAGCAARAQKRHGDSISTLYYAIFGFSIRFESLVVTLIMTQLLENFENGIFASLLVSVIFAVGGLFLYLGNKATSNHN